MSLSQASLPTITRRLLAIFPEPWQCDSTAWSSGFWHWLHRILRHRDDEGRSHQQSDGENVVGPGAQRLPGHNLLSPPSCVGILLPSPQCQLSPSYQPVRNASSCGTERHHVDPNIGQRIHPRDSREPARASGQFRCTLGSLSTF